MFIGILGALIFLSGLAVAVINLVRKIAKKEPLLPKKIVLLMVGVGFVMFASGIAGDDDPEVASSSQSEIVESKAEAESESIEPEAMTAEKWVDEHEKENLDNILADYNALNDETIKSAVNEQVADSDTTMFGKKVEVTGTTVEFVEGSDGMSKGSFIVMTDGGNRVRIAARTPNDALDIGEKVEVTGMLGFPLGVDELYVREAVVMIQ